MNPLSSKYDRLYMNMAILSAQSSMSTVAKVGAVLVLPSGMLSLGWNGTPAGFDNCCEDHSKVKVDELTGLTRHPTKPEVIHAERNAIDKLTRQGVSTYGATLYVTLAPCFECAKAMINLGIEKVIYLEEYKSKDGIELLKKAGMMVKQYEEHTN